jgi:hypothetical protein
MDCQTTWIEDSGLNSLRPPLPPLYSVAFRLKLIMDVNLRRVCKEIVATCRAGLLLHSMDEKRGNREKYQLALGIDIRILDTRKKTQNTYVVYYKNTHTHYIYIYGCVCVCVTRLSRWWKFQIAIYRLMTTCRFLGVTNFYPGHIGWVISEHNNYQF